MQYKSDVVTVMELGLSNPLNGNAFGITNHEVADACYVTNLIFVGGVAYTVAMAHWGAETTLLATRFVVVD